MTKKPENIDETSNNQLTNNGNVETQNQNIENVDNQVDVEKLQKEIESLKEEKGKLEQEKNDLIDQNKTLQETIDNQSNVGAYKKGSFIVYTPVKNFNGTVAGVQFAYGKANVQPGWILDWFIERGYKVEEVK